MTSVCCSSPDTSLVSLLPFFSLGRLCPRVSSSLLPRLQVSYGYTPAPVGGGATDEGDAGDTRAAEPDATYGVATVAKQLTVIQEHVDAAVAAGATVLTGGKADGAFYQPTVLTFPAPTSTPALDVETFGPLLPIVRVASADAAVAAANATAYGLSAYIFTADTAAGGRLARRMATGGVVINDVFLHGLHSAVPFGGRRASGVGRTGGKEGLLGWTTTQTVVTAAAGVADDWAMRRSYEAKLVALRALYGRATA